MCTMLIGFEWLARQVTFATCMLRSAPLCKLTVTSYMWGLHQQQTVLRTMQSWDLQDGCIDCHLISLSDVSTIMHRLTLLWW